MDSSPSTMASCCFDSVEFFPQNPLSRAGAVNHHRGIPRTCDHHREGLYDWEAAQKRGGRQSLFVEREATL